MRAGSQKRNRHATYERTCAWLARLSARLGIRPASDALRLRRLRGDLDASGVDVRAETVLLASRGAAAVSVAAAVPASIMAIALAGPGWLLPAGMACVLLPLMASEVVSGYPGRAARSRAEEVFRTSADGVNLMIMSLRHDASLPRAIEFASAGGSAFAQELRGATWDVVMGRHSSFEEAVLHIGDRWRRHGEELKAALSALVTSSCESTQGGRRRALDRGHNSIVQCTRRRIEEYALSLSTPSMMLFAVGILLPLMVGSFLPLLSWNLWSGDLTADGDPAASPGPNLVQVVFLMNVLFPSITFLIASSAVKRHPLDMDGDRNWQSPRPAHVALAGLAAAGLLAASSALLEGTLEAGAALLSLTCPFAALLALSGGSRSQAAEGGSEDHDVLFKVGSRMVEGTNFETSLASSLEDLDGDAKALVAKASFRLLTTGEDILPGRGAVESTGDLRTLRGLDVVWRASQKDERGAGILSMDLAAYLKDLSEVERSLKSRLKPTVSMMKMTSYALAPIVLGITFSMYLSLGSIIGGDVTGIDAGVFLLVMGAFLAETNLSVSYFVSGIDGSGGRWTFAQSAGACLLVSEAVFVCSALVFS